MRLRVLAPLLCSLVVASAALAAAPRRSHAQPRRVSHACARTHCVGVARRLRLHDPRRHLPRISIADLLPAGSHTRSAAAPTRAPQTFYVDATLGKNRNSGTSPSAPWRTPARVNHGIFVGGDRILFHGGQTFSGFLRFSPANVTGTSAQAHVTLGSYGGGQATLAPGGHSGITVTNVAGFHISELELTGASVACKPHSYGILFYTQHSATTLDQGIAIDHLSVRGFCVGVGVGSGDDHSLFAHIRITDLTSHDNGDAGVFTFDPARTNHDIHDVYVARVQAYNNDGTGGIALFGVEGGVIEQSVAHDNGRGGPGGVGIWAFDADHITIQYNESYKTRTTSQDGDGFDLDGGVFNSVMQYNYAHDNEGMGYLVCGCVEFYEMHNNVVRYNISQNDGTNGQPSGLYVLGGQPFSTLDVFNNSFYSTTGAGTLVLLQAGELAMPEVHLRNNLLAVSASKPLLEVPEPETTPGLAIQGNDWWPTDGHFEVTWGTRQITSLAELRTATGAETLKGAPVGQSGAPEVCALGQGGTIYPRAPAELRAYELRAGSPLTNAGLDLKSSFGTEVGSLDFAGDPSSQGGKFDIGADEHHAGDTC
jgi:Right handed beta helix region